MIWWITFISQLYGHPVEALWKENRLEEAQAICRQYEVLSNLDKDNLIHCSWIYLEFGKIAAAEKLLQSLNKISASSSEVKLLNGYHYLKLKQFEKAKELFDTVRLEARGTPLDDLAQALSGEYYEEKGQLSTAAFMYMQVLKRNPRDIKSQWGLGKYYMSRQEYKKAESHLLAVTEAWPKHSASRYQLALAYMALENLGDAARYLAECYRLDRANVLVLEQIGLLLEKKGKIQEAIRKWQKALSLSKDSIIAKAKIEKYFNENLKHLFEQKSYEEVLKLLETRPELVEKDLELKKLRARVYKETKEYEKAVADYRILLKQKNDPQLRQELGICYLNLSLVDEAGLEFAEANKLEPNNGMHYAWIGFALEAKGDLETSRIYWKKALEKLEDPSEIQKATRKLSSIEKKLQAKRKKEEQRQKKNEQEADDDESRF